MSKKPPSSKVHGEFISGWIMKKRHETISDPSLFYCFVNISKDKHLFKFYIVPNKVVARYVREEHLLWLREKKEEGKKIKDGEMRLFRIGSRKQKHGKVRIPSIERYEDNWDFKS